MNFKLISALAAGLMMSAPTFAANVTLDFEGVDSYASVADAYSSQGITFGGDALAFDAYDVDPGVVFFDGNPSLGSRVMAPVGKGAATMNILNGIAGQISFQYSSVAATSISLYTGLNGTGSLISTFSLDQTVADGACTSSVLCMWDVATLDFGGVARSITFGDATGVAAFDNVQVSAVPLPAAGWLLMSALGGIGAWSRRKRAA